MPIIMFNSLPTRNIYSDDDVDADHDALPSPPPNANGIFNFIVTFSDYFDNWLN